ncbi:hypothetical protein METBIDRAFT_38138 [Metschnikowia bicuspidata var. bicuspidata NRRL YB-4993]|uniref:HECT-type E3 ubiquitin transferase n=1 Tax=Metschnikowia bicuspidata var. bicuspidata NRRL YB-4993 TaxID=869754 RepID=A0A1A0HGU1_9ASCO|nr:hypothetical protein METBIDRAFT_38138 [Metschnikowia bicuspidata var. bicuspidata NRRL YB-4993]OBA23210.1 hypothetical protein METBIDRAFT_38138 [Metschnikowia bicuspidata var. bicuspidata NRRL YB-4993]
MSGGTRRPDFLRDLMERNRAGSGASHPHGILEVMLRLVDGFEGPTFGRQHSEFDALVSNISQRDDTYLILESINELSEKLLMMDGMTAERVIRPNQLARALVDILNDPALVEDLELHLVTCRCLYNFIEVNADFINDALNCEAVETLVAKLLEIVYIDLTEQCLQTLEIMSRDKGAHSLILASDGLRACLQNLDFLTMHSQRKCLQIVANACEDILAVYFDFVLDQFQNLVNVAEHHDDATVKKSAWLGVSRIIDSFKDKPDFLEKLFSNDVLLRHMLSVICDSCNPSNTDVGLNFHSMISLLKSLIILISTSVKISSLLLHLGIGDYIKSSLDKFKKNDDTKTQHTAEISIEAMISCSKDLLSLFLHVIAYLSPITYSPKDTPFLPDDEKISQTKNRINYDRNLLYRNEDADAFRNFTNQVWPVLIGSFQATMDYSIRKQALICLSRMVSFADPELFGKRDMDSLFGILTSIVSSGKKVVSDASVTPSLQERSMNGSVLLLLGACVVTHNILLKSQLSCVPILEREGVFSDLAQISESLRAAGLHAPDSIVNDKAEGEVRFSRLANVYQQKFADRELVDLSLRMELTSILKYLESVAVAINHFREEFSQLGDSLTSENNKLALIVNTLKVAVSNSAYTSDDWNSLWSNLGEALSSSEGGISSFELCSLGLLNQLTQLFQSQTHSESYKDTATKTFIQAFYKESNKLEKLIALLQDSLTRAESFEVTSSGVTNPSGTESGFASLAKQIKIKLIPEDEPNASVARDSIIVSVHAIATFKAIEKFLKQRNFFSGLARNIETNSERSLPENAEDIPETEFVIDGSRISKESTVFGTVFRSLHKSSLKKVEPFDIWVKPHEVYYRSSTNDNVDVAAPEVEDFKPIDPNTKVLLDLLRTFFKINESVEKSKKYKALPAEVFMNWKLTVKLNRQLEEPLIVASGSMPSWTIATTKNYSFVYPLNTRMFFLQSVSFGHSRLIHTWNSRAIKDKADSGNDSTSGSNGSLLLGAPMRTKVRLSRDTIFKGAIKVLQQYGLLPTILEIEYYDEVGSGLGPTLEFYASVSKAFCKKELLMWRHSEIDGVYAASTQGLFPSPISVMGNDEKERKVLFLFNMLGVFVARALLDSRIIDFNFNTLFISLIQDPHFLDDIFMNKKDVSEMIEVLRDVDLDYARGMQYLTKFLYDFRGTPDDDRVEFDGTELSDLSLYFTVPGYADIELVENGSNIAVTPQNLESYIRKVTEHLLLGGIGKQVQSFREGFTSVFPIESLSIFTAKELKEIFGSGEEDWSRQTISTSIKANHGFSQDSRAINMLVNVLQELDLSERRDFLQFLTGSPRLPIGGFKAMRPEFTVVRKHPDAGLSGDDYLPSVMTCANYLKLPDYSLEHLLKTKLLHAIREGAGAFHLS